MSELNKQWLINRLKDLADGCGRSKKESHGQDEVYYRAKEQAYTKAKELAELLRSRSQLANSRFADCHIWETGDKLETISDKCEVLITAADIKTLIAHPANEPLTLEQMRQMDTDMENRPWVWIEVLKPFKYELKTSAYYQVQSDCTHDRAFCCGYPGLGFAFDYDDFGKTWLTYRRKPEGSENDA